MTPNYGAHSSILLAARSMAWTIALPGVVAGYIPWRFFGLGRTRLNLQDPVQSLGVGCVLTGAALLGACIFEFAARGRGTLSPVDPPRQLVVGGPYRYVRNPMYLGVTAIVLGEALLVRSLALGVYWTSWFAGANVFVIAYEEPNLRRRFGTSYDDYARRVARWIPHSDFPRAGRAKR